MAKCENCYHAEICKNYPNTGLPPKMRQELIHKGCEYYINNSDVQEVVRCKDCIHYKEGNLLSPNKFCFRLKHNGEYVGYNFSPDDFCSCGARMDGEENNG